MPRTKPKTSPFSLSQIHNFKDELLNPYFSSRTNCLYQSRGKLRTCIEIKKQQTTKADFQTPTSVDVFQVPKTHGKTNKKIGIKVMYQMKIKKWNSILKMLIMFFIKVNFVKISQKSTIQLLMIVYIRNRVLFSIKKY